jgi:hypothetical protein
MCPAAAVPALSMRVEQKFFVAPQRETLALALLQRTCRPDPAHPHDQVNSLYFDTFDLDQHERSDAGDFVKDKVRIRTKRTSAPLSSAPLSWAPLHPPAAPTGPRPPPRRTEKSRSGSS